MYSKSFIITLFISNLIGYFICKKSTSAMHMSLKYLNTKNPVFVAGGSAGVGYELIKKLSLLGTPVHALVRRKEAAVELEKLSGVKVSIGDAMNESDVQKSMEGLICF
jgi:hypothetical protein